MAGTDPGVPAAVGVAERPFGHAMSRRRGEDPGRLVGESSRPYIRARSIASPNIPMSLAASSAGREHPPRQAVRHVQAAEQQMQRLDVVMLRAARRQSPKRPSPPAEPPRCNAQTPEGPDRLRRRGPRPRAQKPLLEPLRAHRRAPISRHGVVGERHHIANAYLLQNR